MASICEIVTYFFTKVLDVAKVGSIDILTFMRVCKDEGIGDVVQVCYLPPYGSDDYPRGAHLLAVMASGPDSSEAFDTILPLIARRRLDLN